MSKHEDVLDDTILNMTLDEAIPDPVQRDNYVKTKQRYEKDKRDSGGNIEVKKYGVTVDMVATIEQAKAIAHGGDYEVFAHDGHTKHAITPRAFATIPGNRARRKD